MCIRDSHIKNIYDCLGRYTVHLSHTPFPDASVPACCSVYNVSAAFLPVQQVDVYKRQAQKAFENISLEKNFPFDISASLDMDTGQTPPVSIEQAEKIIEKYSAIQQIIRYNIYTSNDNYLHGFTRDVYKRQVLTTQSLKSYNIV